MLRGPGVAFVCVCVAACGGTSSPAPPPEKSAPPGDWTCLGGKPSTAAVAEAEPQSRFEVALQDAYTRAPVGRAQLAICTREDEDCARPVSTGMSDDTGKATLSTPGRPESFDGFVRVLGQGIRTHYVFLPNRVAACAGCPVALPLYTFDALRMTALTTGLAPDARGALVRVDLQDCAGAPAEGATVSIGSFGCSALGATLGRQRTGFPFGPQGCAGPIVAYATGGRGTVSRTALSTDTTGVALGFGVPAGPLGIAELLDGKTVAGALGFARDGAVSTFVVRP